MIARISTITLVVLAMAAASGCGAGGGGSSPGASIAAATSATTTGAGGIAATPSSGATATTITMPSPTATTGATLAIALGPASPAAQTVAPGASRVPVLQAKITASGGDVALVETVLRAIGTADPSRDVALVELVVDQNQNGKYDPGIDVIVGSATYVNGVARFARGSVPAILIPQGVSGDLLVLATFSPTATAGATFGATLDGADATAIDPKSGAALVASGKLSGALATIQGGSTTPSPTGLGTWTTRASMPTPRMKMAAAASDSLVYVVGGRTVAGSLPTLEVYDPLADKWTAKSSLGRPRILHGAAFLNGKVYAVGGSSDGIDVLASVEEYDVATDRWTTIAPLPVARRDLAVVAYQGKIWAIGGFDGAKSYIGTDVLDPTTGQWSAGPQIGTSSTTAAVGGGFIDVFVGTQVLFGPGAPTAPSGSTPAANAFAIASGGSFDFAPVSAAAATNGRVYVVGGMRGSLPVAEMKSIDPSVSAITQGQSVTHAPLAHARRNLAAAAVNGKVYAFGGFDGGATALDVVEQFAP